MNLRHCLGDLANVRGFGGSARQRVGVCFQQEAVERNGGDRLPQCRVAEDRLPNGDEETSIKVTSRQVRAPRK